MKIVITGAGKGIGLETVKKLCANRENHVLALSRTIENLEEMKDPPKPNIRISEDATQFFPPSLEILSFDILNGNYDFLTSFLKSSLPCIDVLINNAGALINKPFLECSAGDFLEMMDANFIGHIKMIQAIIPFLNPMGSHIVNIGSMGGFQGSSKFMGLSAYSASKAAFMNLTECLAEELSEKNIKVNALALGSAQTEMLSKAFPDYKAALKPDEMAYFIADFALNGHRFFNGKILPVALKTP